MENSEGNVDSKNLQRIEKLLSEKEIPASHTGLHNVKKRLKILYGEDADFIPYDSANGFRIFVKIPMKGAN